MKKKLTQIGNSLAVVIDKPILELLKIDKDTELELSTQNGGLVISPVRDGQNAEEIEAILKDLDAQYGSVFKNLA
jgi:antitoxin component of MazEF toxin-antitoxin module